MNFNISKGVFIYRTPESFEGEEGDPEAELRKTGRLLLLFDRLKSQARESGSMTEEGREEMFREIEKRVSDGLTAEEKERAYELAFEEEAEERVRQAQEQIKVH